MQSKNKQSGFSLIELVVVIMLLAVISVVAIPKFFAFQTDARISVLESLLSNIKTINNQIHGMSYLDYVKERANSQKGRLQYMDFNRDGVQQKDEGEWDLIWGYLDNTHIAEALNVSGELVETTQDLDKYYLGYDLDRNGTLDDNCWLLYKQVAINGEMPDYSIETSGC